MKPNDFLQLAYWIAIPLLAYVLLIVASRKAVRRRQRVRRDLWDKDRAINKSLVTIIQSDTFLPPFGEGFTKEPECFPGLLPSVLAVNPPQEQAVTYGPMTLKDLDFALDLAIRRHHRKTWTVTHAFLEMLDEREFRLTVMAVKENGIFQNQKAMDLFHQKCNQYGISI